MSFNDLERGSSGGGSSSSRGGSGLPLYRNERPSSSSSSVAPALPPEFEALTKRLGIQIFKINANVTAITKLISLLSSSSSASSASSSTTNNKGQDFSKKIHDLIETTRDLIKDGSEDVKKLSTFPLSNPSGSSNANEVAKLTQAKLQRDFQSAALQFQKIQKDAVQKTKAKLEQDKIKERQMHQQQQQQSQKPSSARNAQPQQQLLIEEETESGLPQQQHRGQQQEEALDLIQGPTQADLEYQESLIVSREAEIREIESGVQELNEIFRDLGNIVQEQGGMIDNIEFNINSIADNTAGADRELVIAHEYQRKAGRRCIVLLLVVGFVVAVVLLAILS